MPRSTALFRLCTVAALVALAPSGRFAGAQDAPQIAADGNAKLAEIQKKLAAGKDVPDKDGKAADNPTLKRLRIDSFAADKDKDQVVVTGAFIDAGAKANDGVESQVGDAAKALVLKHLGATKEVRFSWAAVKTYGAVDDAGKPKGEPAPHVAFQTAANAAGAKGEVAADRVYATDSSFGPAGEVVVTGSRDAAPAVEAWTAAGAKELAKHPAVRTKDGAPLVTIALAKLDRWPVGVSEVRKALAGSKDAGFRRLRADRAFLAYDGAAPQFTVSGVGLEAEKLDDAALLETLRRLWPEALKTTRVAPDFGGGLVDPFKELRAAVAARRALDGVRVDPGAEFGPAGEFRLAGLRPDLTAEQKKELNDAFQGVLKALAAKGGAADRYKLLESSPASAEGMRPIPVADLRADLRAWAARYRDDVRLRLYFPDNLQTIAEKRFAEPEYGGGLVLVYQVADAADAAAVAARFNVLFAKHFPKGLPGDAVAQAPTDRAKEPLLPGLTAELRAAVAKDPELAGVMIARGTFDDAGRYAISGAVDTKEQNAKLAALVAKLAADDRWKKTYFVSETGADLPPTPPALAVLPMRELLARVQRVTPAYAAFDGVRIGSVRYDATGALVFEATAAVKVTPETVAKLAEMMTDPRSPYRVRVLQTEPPTAPRVQIKAVAAPPYPTDKIGHFSPALGARLLVRGERAKEELPAAKEWIDTALLHYPNVSAVWFLSAYYHQLRGDTELVGRDLQRVVELEGPLAFDGPRQRKTRYEWAKDLQGPKRNALEELWLARYRDAEKGAKPITLAGTE